jgi:poly(3-hydroxybutyrate) depolymerase
MQPSTIRILVSAALVFLPALLPQAAAAPMPPKQEVKLAEGGSLSILLTIPNAGTGRAPLCILLPPGNATESNARMAQFALGEDLVKRKWAVAVPISPNGQPFFEKNGHLIPALIKALQANTKIATGKVLIGGFSNGGCAALEIGSQNPDLFRGVIAVPGTLSPAVNLAQLKQLPVFLRIGEKDDLGWAAQFDPAKQAFTREGIKADAALVPGGKHIFKVSLSELDAWLKTTTAATPPAAGAAAKPAAP